MAQCTDQPLAFGGRITAIEISAEYRIEVEDVVRLRPAECQVAKTFGIGNKADEQSFAHTSEAVGRYVPASRSSFVLPQTDGLPAAQLFRTQADYVRQFARLGDVLKVGEPDLFERQVSHDHARPTF